MMETCYQVLVDKIYHVIYIVYTMYRLAKTSIINLVWTDLIL